jgi:hypothetical protein
LLLCIVLAALQGLTGTYFQPIPGITAQRTT